jgi:hypothetical protein
MALIFCNECGSEVSDKAVNCIKCGNPIRKTVSVVDNVVDFKKIDKKYAEEFQKFHDSKGEYKGKKNGYAFFFTLFWFFAKGCWATGLAYILILVLSLILLELINVGGISVSDGIYRFIGLGLSVHGMIRANYILYNKKVLNKNIWL